MHTPNCECCELYKPNIPPKLSAREDSEASEEDRACHTVCVRLFASKQEAGGRRSCLFPCRCRSSFRELPLTSAPGDSSPLWLSAPTPVRHFFVHYYFILLFYLPSLSSLCYTSSMSASLADPPRCACRAEGAVGAHTHTHFTHSLPPVSSFYQIPAHLLFESELIYPLIKMKKYISSHLPSSPMRCYSIHPPRVCRFISSPPQCAPFSGYFALQPPLPILPLSSAACA